jgi:hypothetical protein
MATYCTLSEFKAFARIDDAGDDTLAQLAIEAATEAIDLALDTTAVQLTPVPKMVKLATQLQASRWFKRRDAPFGVLGSPELGNYTRLLDKLDPDVQLLISGYGERNRWGTTV